jgi:hypothetical protein
MGVVNHPFHDFEVTVGTLCACVMVGLTVVLSVILLIRLVRQLRTVREPTNGAVERALTGVMASAVFAGAAGALILHIASWFVDYFQCLGPLFFLLPLSFALLLGRIDLGFGRRFRGITLRGPVVSVAGVIALGVVMTASGFVTPAALAGPPQQVSLAFVNVNAIDPAVSDCIDKYPFASRATTFASIGTNQFAVECLVPPNMHLVCPLIDQFPSYGNALLEQFKSCLGSRPEIVFSEPLLYFTGYKTTLMAILNEHFAMIGSCGPEEIWQRKPSG